MSYFRTKRIKGKSYLYEVSTRWRKGRISKTKGSRQRVKGYLGKVYGLEKEKEIDFISHFSVHDIEGYVKGNEKGSIVRDLVVVELMNYGFVRKEKFFFNGDIFIDIGDLAFFMIRDMDLSDKAEPIAYLISNQKTLIRDRKLVLKKICLKMNDGYLCKSTLNKLLRFRLTGNTNDGFRLAKAFVDCGLNVPQEIFVHYFEKLANQ